LRSGTSRVPTTETTEPPRRCKFSGSVSSVCLVFQTTDEERLTMLALLLENVGADKAVRLGRPAIWRAAVAALDDAGDQDADATSPAPPNEE
jgi:hypothetical protein